MFNFINSSTMKVYRFYSVKRNILCQKSVLIDDSEDSVNPPMEFSSVSFGISPFDDKALKHPFIAKFRENIPILVKLQEIEHFTNLLKQMFNA